MAYTQLYYHLVWRTKNSVKAIRQEHERDLYMYLYGYCKSHNYKLLRIGGMEDHLHLFVELPSTVCISNVVHDMKITAYNFCKEHRNLFPDFIGWGEGYCALSKGDLEKDKIISYIKGQKEHHKNLSFKDEIKALLEECGVPYNEEYL
ncbi:IS200/IS605 family transposase [Segatella albensis]|uniref:IS200/IS605 family transposase n=1 Tax=Segatella albensis TaxID=77768 RepID=UPI00046A41AC|nr:IS200/IS605 family transposase [Segatella albensis]